MSNVTFNFLKTIGKLSLILSPIVIIAVLCYSFLSEMLLSPADSLSKEAKIIEIAPGTSFRQAAKLLESNGIIKRWWSLDVLSKLKGNNLIKAGEYQFSPAMTPKDILDSLLSGDVYKRVLVFKEGYVMADLGGLLEQIGLLTRVEVNKALQDAALLRKLGVTADSFEGYLFPNTYYFSRPARAEDVIATMVAEGEKRWKQEYEERAKNMGYSRHEVLTFASIIEKESGNAEEQPTVSSVFHNRLKAGWPLQSDPTAVYGIPGFTGPIRRKHLQIDSPYNTYKIRGLPPGPICNPGESAIRAVMYPDDTPYMYFVSDGDGTHIFSVNLKEHERAVEFYRRRQALLSDGATEDDPETESP